VKKLLLLLLLVSLVVAACGPSVGSPSPSPRAVTSTPSASAAGCVGNESFPPAAVDRSLLDVLPESVDGIAVAPSPDGEAAGVSDVCLASIADSFASGFAADPENFVFTVVVSLRDGALNEDVYRSWRDTFDEGACSQADGISGHAETEMGGRTVYIGTCTGGLRTYHVWLEDRGVLVSASAAGERRLGERLVGTLRP
jgi:hypothetical protein